MSNLPLGLRRATTTIMAGALLGALGTAVGPTAAAAPDAGLTRKLNAVLSDGRIDTTGAVVLDARTGERLYSRNGSEPLLPASNTKIVTGAAALEVLGEDYRFRTEVIRRAAVVDGVLQGRLYLKGYGDPTLRQADLARLAEQVRDSGITKVTGKLIVDASYFDSQRYNPGWSTGYADEYYAAPIAGLTLAPNADYDSGTIYLNYRPGSSTGRKAKITTTPAAAADYVKIVNKTVTSARGTSTSFSAARKHGSNTITVRGRVPKGRSTASWLITVDRPELLAAAVFRAELAKRKITVGSTLLATIPAGGHQGWPATPRCGSPT